MCLEQVIETELERGIVGDPLIAGVNRAGFHGETIGPATDLRPAQPQAAAGAWNTSTGV